MIRSGMYIRKSIRSYKGATYTNYVLVESVHTAKGPRQRAICSLGDLSPRPAEDWLKLARKIEDALVGQADLLDPDKGEGADIVRRVRDRREAEADSAGARAASPHVELINIDPSRVSTERHREAGPVHVGYQFWRRLELDRILAGCGLSETVRRLSCAMTLNRLIAPCSEHAMPDWIRRTALGDILGVDFDRLAEDPLYEVLDKLYPLRAAIEAALVARERSLFNLDATIYLYDLTSTYFEGLAKRNGKAKRGYSRDHRPDCKQVVVGLVLDRGMAFDENIAELQRRKLTYVVASQQPERNRWLADFEDTDGFAPVLRAPSPLNPAQKKTSIEVKTRVADEQTYVLCRSEQRIAKDRAIRGKHEQRLLADIDKLSRRIANKRLVKPEKINQAIGRLKERYPRVARYYNLAHDPQTASLSATLDPDKHAKAQRLDGCYLLKTNRKDLSGDELWRIYVLLTRAETAFRDMKSPLAERPIFHHLEQRVDAHIFVCVLAYHLLIAIEKTLLDQGIHTSWPTVRDTLKTHQVCTIVLPTSDGSILRIRKAGAPDTDVLDLYRHLALPEAVIKPQHTWTKPNSD